MAKQTPTTPEVQENTLLPYQKIDALTGGIVDKFKMLEGHPRQYRFDAKEGIFTINGE